MKVYLYPADVFGCGHYRLIWPGDINRLSGHDVEVILPDDDSRLGLAYDLVTRQLTVPIYPADADVIVLQRPSHPHLIQLIPLLRRVGVAVVVDIDDDLAHIHPSNPAFSMMHPRSTHQKGSWNDSAQACRDATLVTVSTPALVKRYGAHGRVRVLENCVPGEYTTVEREDATWIGWPGSGHSHPNDFIDMRVGLTRLMDEGHRFKVVGNSIGLGRQLGLPVDPSETGTVDFYEWSHAVATIGVGIAPLADTKFKEAKSWLKPLEMSAVGVPWVASPRVEYTRLHERGCGLLAEKPRQWERTLRSLVTDEVLRKDLSERGRSVALSLTYEEHAWKWMEAWQHARDLQDRL